MQGRAAVTGTGEPAFSIADWIQLVRVPQWIKNFFVLAPLLFSGEATRLTEVARAFAAFTMFCLLASAIYLWNDAADAAADRAHPTKRDRPIAAGRIAPRHARTVGAVLAAAALVFAWLIAPPLALIALTYLGLNVLYTVRLKEMVLLDVFALAAFFILRLLAGATAIGVRPSIWLLLCGGLLALYLGFTKRRHELSTMGSGSAEHRSVLSHYSPAFLDQMSGVLLSVTVVSYILYTVSSETARNAGDDLLTYSTVFVLYGVFRYLYLVHLRDGGSPTRTLLTDRALMVNVILWVAYCAWVIY
ncbi:MAG: decaprenyl-phosphate phosphoribosyltransferase [Anaerolineae bacterium]|nr:decaprenyl-phosphate phosphoribosyltransferase [Gemmatimonadaceae bacterium]